MMKMKQIVIVVRHTEDDCGRPVAERAVRLGTLPEGWTVRRAQACLKRGYYARLPRTAQEWETLRAEGTDHIEPSGWVIGEIFG